MDKSTKKMVNDHLDFIVKLKARAEVANEMFLFDIAEGALEDVERRKNSIRSLIQQSKRWK